MGEVANIVVSCQFSSNYTYYACGYFALTEMKYMTPPSVKNTTSTNTIFMEAMHTYRLYNGANGPGDTSGMSNAQTLQMYKALGLNYTPLGAPGNVIARIREAVKYGNIVQVAISEPAIYDMALGRNPYTDWNPAGIHAILISGVDSNGNFIVRDSANCTGWVLRSQPRVYRASTMGIVNSYVVFPKWDKGC